MPSSSYCKKTARENTGKFLLPSSHGVTPKSYYNYEYLWEKTQLQNKYVSYVHKLHIWSALDDLDKAHHSWITILEEISKFI